MQAYKIYSYSPDTLIFTGYKVDPDSTTIHLRSGWNWIPYLIDSVFYPCTAMSNITSTSFILKNGNGDVYWPEYEVDDIGLMKPGEGYEIYLDSSCNFHYSHPHQYLHRATNITNFTNMPKPEFLIPTTNKTGNNAIFMLLTNNIPDNFEIGVWNEVWELVGSGRVQNGKCIITIWGDNEATNEIDGAIINENLYIKAYDYQQGLIVDLNLTNIFEVTQKQNLVTLNYKKNGIYKANASIDTVSNFIYQLESYPNPFQDNTVISYTLLEQSQVTLIITDHLGTELSILVNAQTQSAGEHEVQFIPNSNFTSGIYNCSLSVGNNIESIQLLIIR